MAIKTVLDPVKGVVQTKVADGEEEFQIPPSMKPAGVSPWKLNTKTFVADGTLSADDAGAVIVSGTAAPIVVTMPNANAAAGATFVVRGISLHAHVLTASLESNGTVAFSDIHGLGAASGLQGSSLTLPAVVNSSVIVQSDGANWCVLGGSGSYTIAGT